MNVGLQSGRRVAALCIALAGAAMSLQGPAASADATPRDDSALPAAGTIVNTSLYSQSLRRSVKVAVYLPPDYPEPDVQYPVLYLLHGLPGNGPGLFSDLHILGQVDWLIDTGQIRPMLIVAPSDGPTATTDTEWMNSEVLPDNRWESFVTGDLVSWTDATYATCPQRAARSIGGPSMGAFGALNAALAAPSEFGAVTLWSPYFVANTPLVDGPAGSASWRAASPLYSFPGRLSTLRQFPLRISFYSSRDDEFYPQSVAFASLLTRADVPHRFVSYPGVHSDVLWAERLAAELTWLSLGEQC